MGPAFKLDESGSIPIELLTNAVSWGKAMTLEIQERDQNLYHLTRTDLMTSLEIDGKSFSQGGNGMITIVGSSFSADKVTGTLNLNTAGLKVGGTYRLVLKVHFDGTYISAMFNFIII